MRTWAFRVAFAALRGFVPPQGARGASAQLFKHRAVRTVGGFIIALLASCFAALSHAVAAHTPSLLALFVSVLTATPLAIAAVGKKHSFFALSSAVVAIQAAFHWVFVWLTPAHITGAHHAHTSHIAHSTAKFTSFNATANSINYAATGSFLQSNSQLIPQEAHISPLMFAAHVIAAVFAIALLYTAEAAVILLFTKTQAAIKAVLLLDKKIGFISVLHKAVYCLRRQVIRNHILGAFKRRGPPLFSV